MPVRRNVRGAVVACYRNEADAIAAIRALNRAGFTADDVSVITRERERAAGVADQPEVDATEGARVGGTTGGALGALGGLLVGAGAVTLPGIGLVIAGPLVAALMGAGAGVLTGGLAGALVGLGVSEEEANILQDRYQEGDIIVSVMAGDRQPETRELLAAGFPDSAEHDVRDGDPA